MGNPIEMWKAHVKYGVYILKCSTADSSADKSLQWRTRRRAGGAAAPRLEKFRGNSDFKANSSFS